MKRFVLMLGPDGKHFIEKADPIDVDELLKRHNAVLVYTSDTLEEAEGKRDEEIRRQQIRPI